MRLTEMQTCDVLDAIGQSWSNYMLAYPGCDYANEPSLLVRVYASCVMARRAARDNGASAQAHLFARCTKFAGDRMDEDLKASIDKRMRGIKPLVVEHSDLKSMLQEAQRFFLLDDMSRPASA